MAIKQIDDREVWDSFIDESPHGLLFHKWDFLRIIEKYTHQKVLRYGIYKGAELICAFPLFYGWNKGLKTVFSPPPLVEVPYLGFVMNSLYPSIKQRRKENYLNYIADEVHKEIERIAPHYVYIFLVPELTDVRPFKWDGYDIDTHYSYLLDLDRHIEKIYNNFGKDCKERIKACMKGTCTLSEIDNDIFYDIMKDRYEQQGLNFPIANRHYIDDILKTFPENIKIYGAFDKGEVRDIELVCKYKKRFLLWMGGATIKKGVHGYQEYATWELIKKAKSESFNELEIYGAGEKRLCYFQSKFNPRLEVSFSLHKKDTVGTIAEWAYLNLYRKRTFAFNYLNILTQYMV